MLGFPALIAFALAAGVLTITPGMDTALVLRTAAVEGSGRARWVALGCCTGCLFWGSATAFGLTALLVVSQTAYNIVRIAGAAYLIYLGIRLFLQKHAAMADAASATAARKEAGTRWFVRGLLSNLLNPKVGVFYVTLLPQFIPHGANVAVCSLLLTTLHVCEGVIWLFALTLAVRPLGSWLRRPRVSRNLDRATGTVLIGCGLALAVERRS
jgi:threonine/homoserine/homoserine lactone efflux protein